MTEAELKAIEERAAEASQGPFSFHRQPHCHVLNCHEMEIRDVNGGSLFRSTSYGLMEADAEFFAHAREDIPALLAEVRRLREALKFYAGKPGESEWEGCKFLTFDKFGCLDEDIAGPFVALAALEGK